MKPFQKVAAHALIKKDGKYLVTHRVPDDDHAPNVWDIPGGSTDFGENPEDAVVREVLEETSLKIKVGKLLYCYSHLSNPQRHQFQLVYECDYLGGEVILNPKEHDQFLWVDIDEIGKLEKIAFLENLYNQILNR